MNENGINVLIIGVRRNCYEAAIGLGFNTFLWSDSPLSKQRQKNLAGYVESPYIENLPELNSKILDFVKKNKINRVVANAEQTVILGSLVRRSLGLTSLAVDVTQRFHDKYVMKNSATQANIPITKYFLIKENTTPDELIENLGLPLVIKPVSESGARNVKVCKNNEEVSEHMTTGLLAEAFVKGSEVSVETFIQDGKPIFHNITEYLHQWKKSAIPAQIDESLKKQILELNDKVLEHFEVDRGVTHSEFYLTDKGPVFGEIAIRPPGGYYMELIKKVYDFDTWETYVKLSCGHKINSINQTPKGCSAVVIFHPDSGTIKSIKGEEALKNNIKHIIELNIRKKVGDIVAEHSNTSNEIGHILFWEETREELEKSIEFIEKTLIFEMQK